MHRLTLLVIAFIFTTICVALVATGGFVTAVVELRVSARSPVPAAVAASVGFLAWVVLSLRAKAIAADLRTIDTWIERRSVWLISAIAGIAGAVAVRYQTYSASGADPSG